VLASYFGLVVVVVWIRWEGWSTCWLAGWLAFLLARDDGVTQEDVNLVVVAAVAWARDSRAKNHPATDRGALIAGAPNELA